MSEKKTNPDILKKTYESLNTETKTAMGRLRRLIEKRAMDPQKVAELIDSTMQGDKTYPEIQKVEEMTSQEYADLYDRMSEEFALEPEKHEAHVQASGMSPDDLAILFAQINGIIVRYPEVWESRENARMLHPNNLMALASIFKKEKKD